jgi:hypothetical protein
MSQYISARDKWKLSTAKFLSVGESPSASGGYFYFERQLEKDRLFVETLKALQLIPENGGLPRGFDKKLFLEKFRSRGTLLSDESYEPVNNRPVTERKLAIKKEIPRFVNDVKKLNPKNITIVKSSIYVPVRAALEKRSWRENSE